MDTQVTSVAALQEKLAGVFDLAADPMAGDRSTGFAARATSAHVLTRTETPALRLLRGHNAISGGIDGFAILLVVSGALQGRVGDGRVEARTGDVLVIDLLQTLDVTLLPDERRAENLILWLSRAQVMAATPNDNFLHGLLLPAPSPAGALVGAGLKILSDHAGQLSSRDFDAVAEGVVALMSKIITPVLESRSASAAPQASFVTIRRYIDRNLQSPTLDAARLAKTFGLSRAALYRLFEPVGGVASYIRRARLNRAYQEIVSAEVLGRRIGPIAYGLGFKNLSAFNRLFRSTFGVSPSEARRKPSGGFDGIAFASRPRPGEDTLGAALRRLS